MVDITAKVITYNKKSIFTSIKDYLNTITLSNHLEKNIFTITLIYLLQKYIFWLFGISAIQIWKIKTNKMYCNKNGNLNILRESVNRIFKQRYKRNPLHDRPAWYDFLSKNYYFNFINPIV